MIFPPNGHCGKRATTCSFWQGPDQSDSGALGNVRMIIRQDQRLQYGREPVIDDAKRIKLEELVSAMPDSALEKLDKALSAGGDPLGAASPVLAALIADELQKRAQENAAQAAPETKIPKAQKPDAASLMQAPMQQVTTMFNIDIDAGEKADSRKAASQDPSSCLWVDDVVGKQEASQSSLGKPIKVDGKQPQIAKKTAIKTAKKIEGDGAALAAAQKASQSPEQTISPKSAQRAAEAPIQSPAPPASPPLQEVAKQQPDQPAAILEPLPLGDIMLKPRNAMHAFFGPLEGLITDPVHYAPRQEGTIASTSLPAIWRLLNEEIGSGIIRDSWVRYETRMHAPEQANDQLALEKLLKDMHRPAEMTIRKLARKAGKEPGYRRSLILRLGGEAVYGDLLELGLMLPHAKLLGKLYRAVVSSAPLPDRHARIAMHLVQYAQKSAARVRYGFCLFLAKLWSPVEALKLQSIFSELRRQAGAPFKPELDEYVTDALASRLDRQNSWLERQTALDGMDEAVVGVFSCFADCCLDLNNFEEKDLPVELRDITKNYGRQSGLYFDRLLDQAVVSLREALPASAQDIGRDPGAELLMERAITATGFLGENDGRADSLGRLEAYDKARKSSTDALLDAVAVLEKFMAPGPTRVENEAAIAALCEQLSALAERLQNPSDARKTVARLEAIMHAA